MRKQSAVSDLLDGLTRGNITSEAFAHMFSVALGSGENVKKSTLQYGTFLYAYTTLPSDVASVAKQEELCNVLKAMCEYHSVAYIYFNQLNQ